MALLGFPSCTEHADDALLAGPQKPTRVYDLSFCLRVGGSHDINFVNKIVCYRLDINQAHSQAHLDEVVLRELGPDAEYLQRRASPRPTELSGPSSEASGSPNNVDAVSPEMHKDISYCFKS